MKNMKTLINHHVKNFISLKASNIKSSLKLMVKFLFCKSISKSNCLVVYGIAAVIKKNFLRFKRFPYTKIKNSPSHK